MPDQPVGPGTRVRIRIADQRLRRDQASQVRAVGCGRMPKLKSTMDQAMTSKGLSGTTPTGLRSYLVPKDMKPEQKTLRQ